MGIANFDSRKSYFDGIGSEITGAQDLETAIKLAKLDFEVEKRQIYLNNPTILKGSDTPSNIFTPIHDQFATVRTDTDTVLGVVKKNYQVLQNREAFDFLDSVIAGGARFETAGTFKKNEAASFITCSTEPIKILDDDIHPYLLFVNSFDGSSSVRVMFTPIRIFCSNCLVRAMKGAMNKVSIRHSPSMKDRLDASKEILLSNTNYLEALKAESEKLAVTTFSAEAFEALARSLFPTKEGNSNIIQIRNEEMIEALLRAYRQDDLQNFNNTAYKAVQAVADFESHKPTHRQTKTAEFSNFNTVIMGMPMLNMVADRMNALVA